MSVAQSNSAPVYSTGAVTTVTAVGAHVVRAVDGSLKLQQLGRVETVMTHPHSPTTPPAAAADDDDDDKDG